MKDEKVLIEKFQGFDIYYDKEHELFVADKPNLKIHFEEKSLWSIKGEIKTSKTEEVGKDCLIKSGYFNKTIAKVRILTQNKITKRVKYEVLEDTEDSYDVGKIQEDRDTPTQYPLSDYNLTVYNKVMNLEKQINKIEEEQKELVAELKK